MLDRRFADLARAEVDEVANARENRRLAQLDAERKRQEEARHAAAVAPLQPERKTIRKGDAGYIEVEGDSVVWVSINEKALSELNAFSRARNEDAIRQMIQQGRVLVCAKGTRVSVVDPGFFSTTVRIMDGNHSGMTGIVPNEFLHK